VSASAEMWATEWMPLMKGIMRVSVRSEDMGDVSEESEMVRRGTWWEWIGGGGGCVGKSLRFIVLESSVAY
jgi:hypothetical protein